MPTYRSYVDQTLGYFDRPHVGVPTAPIGGPAAWRSADLGSPDTWTRRLSEAQRDELVAVGQRLVRDRVDLAELEQQDAGLDGLGPLVEECRTILGDGGRGFVLLTGFPVEQMAPAECEAAYWTLGTHLGRPGAQNGRGELLGHVRDYHDDASLPLQREYRSAVEIAFHCDAADVVGLLCLSASAQGGDSRLVSSVAVLDEMLRTSPKLVARLCEPAELDTRDDGGGFEHVPVQLVCFDGTTARTFMHLGYFRSAARHAGVEVDAVLAAALDAWEAIAARPDMHLDMSLRPGDLQLCSNHTVAHSRTAYVDDRGSPRHLLRLWITLQQRCVDM